MQKTISRRQFLGATVAGGASLLVTRMDTIAQAKPRRPLSPVSVHANHVDYDEVIQRPIYKTHLTAHWFDEDRRFWYCNELADGKREFYLVEAEHGLRKIAFDHTRLAASLTPILGHTVDGEHLPFKTLVFTDDAATIKFIIGDKAWQCDLATYTLTPIAPADAVATTPEHTRHRPERDLASSPLSPDGHWNAFVRDGNVFIKDTTGTERQFTQDGTNEKPYGALTWSPDSKTLVGYAITPIPIAKVYMVESSPKNGSTRGVLHEHEYAQPGDPFSIYEMCLFHPDAAMTTATRAQIEPLNFGDDPSLRWDEDGSRFTFERMDRGYQRFRVIAIDAATGNAMTLIDDTSATFIDSTTQYVWYSHNGDEILYASEKDGWRHLYLYNGRTGALKNQITSGKWVVRGVQDVDTEKRQIWFSASGKNTGEDPYHQHRYRIDFDGKNFTTLTDGNGTHDVTLSPNKTYLIDTYSRAGLPAVHTLRRASDGAHLCDLERADISALTEAGWRAPQVFSAKGRDGVTEIWGIVFRPLNFDPSKKYPIIENIYAGPQDNFTRKSFAVSDGMQSLAELGFIVVQCDGMGTRNRSKAFHDVCWHNIKDAGFPDRIAWMKALAHQEPACDITRVGIYGTSAGGQNATGALLFHPEFYKVGVSSCGCHDNRIDKQWWNEQWMGYPVGPWYDESSNITNAHKLSGKLLLIVGELDSNVPPESTIRLTDALMKADKDFDLIIVTGSDHTSGGAYGERRRRDFFVRHLQGIEPPDRNAPRPQPKPVNLEALPPEAASDAQPDGASGTTVQFTNQRKHPIELFWLPGDGSRKSYGVLQPGETHTQNTYANHSWLVTEQNGPPIAVFVGVRQPGIAIIR